MWRVTCGAGFTSRLLGLSAWRQCAPQDSQQRFSHSAMDSPPDIEEVRKAYRTLGASTSNDFKAVRHNYLKLAKEHHPDVKGKTGSSGPSMASINEAYSVIEKHFKTGGRPPETVSGGGSSTGRSSYAPHQSGGGPRAPEGDPMRFYADEGFADMFSQGAHLDAEGWEQFFAWNEGKGPAPPYGFGFEGYPGTSSRGPASSPEEDEYEAMRQFYGQQGAEDYGNSFQGGKPERGPYARQRQQKQQRSGSKPKQSKRDAKSGSTAGGERQGKDGGKEGGAGAKEGGAKTKKRAWSDSERDALANMYSEGKSFEFIGNALGRDLAEVLDEYNFMSHAAQQQSERMMRGSGGGAYGGAFPGADMEDAFFGDPEAVYYTLDDEGNILHQMDPDEMDDDDDEPVMGFSGRGSTMHGFQAGGPSHGHQKYTPSSYYDRRGNRKEPRGGRGGGGGRGGQSRGGTSRGRGRGRGGSSPYF